jgi:hypothetical protein
MAGVLFAMGLQLKFIGALYLPLAAWILWLGRAQAPHDGNGVSNRTTRPLLTRRLLQSVGWFSAGLMAAFFVIGRLAGDGAFLLQLQQSWGAHFAAAKTLAYGSPQEHPFDWSALVRNWDATVPALVGIFFLLRQRDARTAVPVVWLGLTLLVLGTHKPWWTYYYVHTAVPLCWCAAVGFYEVGRRVRGRLLPKLALGTVALCVLVWAGARVQIQIAGIRHSAQTYSSLVLTEMARFQPAPDYLFTDEPVFSFHAGIPLPPKLGVISLKRFWSGELTHESLTAELAKVRPGLMLLKNDSLERPYQELLQKEYRLVYYDEDYRLYALKTLKAKVP